MPADPDLLSRLRPVRLPGSFETASWSLAFAALSLGIVLALLFMLVLRLATDRRESRLAAMRRELAAAALLPDAERLFAQAKLIDRLTANGRGSAGANGRSSVTDGRDGRTAAGALRAAIGEGLYRPGARPDLAAIDAAILDLVSRNDRPGRGRPGDRGTRHGPVGATSAPSAEGGRPGPRAASAPSSRQA